MSVFTVRRRCIHIFSVCPKCPKVTDHEEDNGCSDVCLQLYWSYSEDRPNLTRVCDTVWIWWWWWRHRGNSDYGWTSKETSLRNFHGQRSRVSKTDTMMCEDHSTPGYCAPPFRRPVPSQTLSARLDSSTDGLDTKLQILSYCPICPPQSRLINPMTMGCGR